MFFIFSLQLYWHNDLKVSKQHFYGFIVSCGVVKETTDQVTFNPDLHHRLLQDFRVELYNMFEELIDRGTADNRDMTRIFINHPNLDQPIVVPPQPLEDMRLEDTMQLMENTIQSGKVLNICERGLGGVAVRVLASNL